MARFNDLRGSQAGALLVRPVKVQSDVNINNNIKYLLSRDLTSKPKNKTVSNRLSSLLQLDARALAESRVGHQFN